MTADVIGRKSAVATGRTIAALSESQLGNWAADVTERKSAVATGRKIAVLSESQLGNWAVDLTDCLNANTTVAFGLSKAGHYPKGRKLKLLSSSYRLDLFILCKIIYFYSFAKTNKEILHEPLGFLDNPPTFYDEQQLFIFFTTPDNLNIDFLCIFACLIS